ncbi:uncharacterized protein METZ01_LOCUS146240 [marine metagenome]|uniref:Uncharacterized protein n=1 Tax=marine metagenome TaxID=408172 RepID=A0A381ZVU7_9ZZZZ
MRDRYCVGGHEGAHHVANREGSVFEHKM